MRYHLFKTSPTRNLNITDSQGRNLTFPNFNILVLPGARIGDVRPFLPAKGRFDLIVLFNGGNDLPTDNTRTVARNISDLAVAAIEAALRVFFIAVPPRLDIPDQAKASTPRRQQRSPLASQRHISKHLQHRKTHYRRRHPPRA